MNLNAAEFEYDDSDPEGYRAGLDRLGPKLGATETGTSVYELPPGQSICPYHYEWAEEEWLVVLTGRPVLRVPSGEEQLETGDVRFFPLGPDGAHKVTNTTDETVRVLMFSTLKYPAMTVYPDSDKIGMYSDPGRTDSIRVRRGSNVDYYDGEA